jgi:hypothetical protein
LEAEGLARLDIGEPVSDHPGGGAVITGMLTEGLFQESRAGLAAGAEVLGFVKAEMRAQDFSPTLGYGVKDRLVNRFQVPARRLSLGCRRLVAHDDRVKPGLIESPDGFRGPRDHAHLSGGHGAVDGSLFRIHDQLIEDAVAIEQNESFIQILNAAFCASL